VSQTLQGAGQLHYPSGRFWGWAKYDLALAPDPRGRLAPVHPRPGESPFVELCGPSNESYLLLEGHLKNGDWWLRVRLVDPDGVVAVLSSHPRHPRLQNRRSQEVL
jgi:hypothetical protein